MHAPNSLAADDDSGPREDRRTSSTPCVRGASGVSEERSETQTEGHGEELAVGLAFRVDVGADDRLHRREL